MMQQAGQDGLLALLFGNEDKVVRNVKFFRGNATNLTLNDMCEAAADVIRDTWDRDEALRDILPFTGQEKVSFART